MIPFFSQAVLVTPNFKKEGIVSTDVDSFYDINVDYARFAGRVTDKDYSGKILKIRTEINNIKFFRAGDKVQFRVANKKVDKFCSGHVRNVEKFHFVLFVNNLSKCFPDESYFRRGTQLYLYSPTLADRVIEGSRHRKTLLVQKDDFLKQLNKINHFLWSFDQERIKVAAEYDQQILDLTNKKQKAMDDLIALKKDSMALQKELISKLDTIDEQTNYFKVERQEPLTDRWVLDHDLGVPVGNRPQDIKEIEDEKSSILTEHRWHRSEFE